MKAQPSLAPVPLLEQIETKFPPLVTRFDLKQKPVPRPMLIQDVGPERGVLAVTGDTGACKSIATEDLARAVRQCGSWLGYKVNRSGAVCIFDAENDPEYDILGRFHAMQLSDAELDGIHFYASQDLGGVDLERWVMEIERHVTEVEPVLVIVDALFSAGPGMETGNNDAITPFMRAIKRIATAHGCLIVVIHHHKKPQQGAPRAAKYQASGAQQFINQVNNQLALSVAKQEADEQADGSRQLSTVVRVENGKSRSTIGGGNVFVAVDSTESAPDADGNRTLSDLTVRRLEGEEAVTETNGTYGKVVAALREVYPDTLRRKDIAGKAGCSLTAVDNATAYGLEHGSIEQPAGKGTPYRSTEPPTTEQPPI
jgi:hypothetical protein